MEVSIWRWRTELGLKRARRDGERSGGGTHGRAKRGGAEAARVGRWEGAEVKLGDMGCGAAVQRGDCERPFDKVRYCNLLIYVRCVVQCLRWGTVLSDGEMAQFRERMKASELI